MDPQAIITLVVPVVLTILAHRYDVIDLGKAGGKPADPTQLPPAVVHLPNHPYIELLIRKLEKVGLDAVHEKLDAVVAPAQPAAPAVAQK